MIGDIWCLSLWTQRTPKTLSIKFFIYLGIILLEIIVNEFEFENGFELAQNERYVCVSIPQWKWKYVAVNINKYFAVENTLARDLFIAKYGNLGMEIALALVVLSF